MSSCCHPCGPDRYVYSFSQIASSVQAQQLDVLTQNFPFIRCGAWVAHSLRLFRVGECIPCVNAKARVCHMLDDTTLLG